MWRGSWEPIVGRVIASDTTGQVWGDSGGANVRMKYVVEYQVDGGEPKRVELKQAWALNGLPKMVDVSNRREVPLLLNRRSGKVRFDTKNPAINYKAWVKDDERRDAFDEALKSEDASPIHASGTDPVKAGEASGTFRMTVEDVLSLPDRGTVATGRVERGSVRVGDGVRINDGALVRVDGIEMFRKRLDEAREGDNIGLLFEGLELGQAHEGDVITGPR